MIDCDLMSPRADVKTKSTFRHSSKKSDAALEHEYIFFLK